MVCGTRRHAFPSSELERSGQPFFGIADQRDPGDIVDLRQASDWFGEHISDDDEVYLKLNCEGSECDILDDLLDSGEIEKVTSILVDFDVRKIPALAHREREVRERLSGAGHSNLLCLKERYKGPTHTATVDNWLHFAGARSLPPPAGWKWRYVWFPALVRKTVAFSKGVARRILPQSAYERLRLAVQKIVYSYPPDANSGLVFALSRPNGRLGSVVRPHPSELPTFWGCPGPATC